MNLRVLSLRVLLGMSVCAPLLLVAAPAQAQDSSDVREEPGKRYYFLGLRYRGNIVPVAFENLFVDEGATVWSNGIGIELDSRKDGSSLIPSITYIDYNTGNILFHEKGKPDTANNWSYVNSSLKAIYLAVDQLWSVPMAKNVEFEYGFGAGIGFIFGNLANNWVYDSPNGPLITNGGRHFAPCQTERDDVNCNAGAHNNAQTAKVFSNGGPYQEPNWWNGGSVPGLFPDLRIQIGLRLKFLKQFESRFNVGLGLTGVTFGFSADYGFESSSAKAAQMPRPGQLRF